MLTAARALGGLVLLKAVDVALRGPVSGRLWLVGLVLLAAAGAALLAGWDRGGWVLMVAGAVATAVDAPVELRRQHLVLLALVGLAALAARTPVERRLLWSVQLSALYGTAAMAKLNEVYLSGTVVAAAVADAPFGTGVLGVPPLPLAVAASLALVAAEVLLAAVPWVPRLHRLGLTVAAAFHLVAVPLAGAEPLVALRLVVFGGTALVLLAAVTGRLEAERRAPPSTSGRPARRMHR